MKTETKSVASIRSSRTVATMSPAGQYVGTTQCKRPTARPGCQVTFARHRMCRREAILTRSSRSSLVVDRGEVAVAGRSLLAASGLNLVAVHSPAVCFTDPCRVMGHLGSGCGSFVGLRRVGLLVRRLVDGRRAHETLV